jgi:hypothetical protein
MAESQTEQKVPDLQVEDQAPEQGKFCFVYEITN